MRLSTELSVRVCAITCSRPQVRSIKKQRGGNDKKNLLTVQTRRIMWRCLWKVLDCDVRGWGWNVSHHYTTNSITETYLNDLGTNFIGSWTQFLESPKWILSMNHTDICTAPGWNHLWGKSPFLYREQKDGNSFWHLLLIKLNMYDNWPNHHILFL